MTSLFTQAELAAYQKLLRPILSRWAGDDPEAIYEATTFWLGHMPAIHPTQAASPVTVTGIEFPNRVGVATGLDRDRVTTATWARLGFGHAELGTVTGQAQPGNPRPQTFRTWVSRGVINRMGFNDCGAGALADQLLKPGVQRGNHRLGIPLGAPIGKAKAIALVDATSDYLVSLDVLWDHADCFVVNVSSSSTPGLRSLQTAKELEQLLGCIVESVSQGTDPIPVLVKLASDLEPGWLTETVAVIRDCGAAGIIATDTTLSREGLAADNRRSAGEEGELSGAPLTTRALVFVEQVVLATDFPVIGVGGIILPHGGMRMLEVGVVLPQIYMGFIYVGSTLVRGLNDLLRCA